MGFNSGFKGLKEEECAKNSKLEGLRLRKRDCVFRETVYLIECNG